MTETLESFLKDRIPAAEEMEMWGDLAAWITAYLSSDDPPPEYVTSVRRLIFRG